jgi:outer membrane protein assembly factor BamB
MSISTRQSVKWLFVNLFFVSGIVQGADWPTYRYDNSRSGALPETLGTPLALQWEYQPLHGPEPAWSAPAARPREGFKLKHRVIFDDAFQVAAVGNTIYFGSSGDNKIYALDAATGQERWAYFTGGPIRLAPTYSKDRLYVGSDDGFIYCLRANDGELVWKLRGGPNGEKLLGHGKMISRWPIRTGVLVDDGIAYFGAGVFPHENIYLYAVNAENGTIIWKNDTISQSSAYRNDLSPQGYLLATKEQLFIPSGRDLPVGFDRSNGKLLFDKNYGWRGVQAGGMIGGTYALLADGQIYTGTQEHLLALDQKTGSAGFGWFPGKRLAVVGTMAYLATGKELIAMDRSAYAVASQQRNTLEFKIKSQRRSVARASGEKRKKLNQELKNLQSQLERHRKENIQPTIRWRVNTTCDAELALCQNLVVAGGQDKVEAYDRGNGKLIWSAKVTGKARGLGIANGRLIVSTDQGNMYCYSAGEGKGEIVKQQPKANPYKEDEMTKVYRAAAEAIVKETGITQGYCLVLGAEQGRLAYELAQLTKMKIIGIESNGRKVKAARKALDAAGLYGERVIIEQGKLTEITFSNYFANLIVSDRLLVSGRLPRNLKDIARHVKPQGGTVCLGIPGIAQTKGVTQNKLKRWLQQLDLGSVEISLSDGRWATVERGALPGAGKWTHQYGDPGNTACSDETRLGGPLGVLWFGEPGSAPMVNRHDAAAAPLAVNGNLFIQGENNVMVYDSYNGSMKWKREIPGAKRTRLKGYECSNLAATEDRFFAAAGDKCYCFDADTGKTRAQYTLPTELKSDSKTWGYLAFVEGILYGSTLTKRGVSDSVFAIDTRSGEPVWSYDGDNIVNLTISIGEGRVFFIDRSLSPSEWQALLQKDKSHLKNLEAVQSKKAEAELKKVDIRLAVALDAKTGKKIWERPVDVTQISRIGIGGGELSTMYKDGMLVFCGANANGHYWRQFLKGDFSKRRLVVLSAKDGMQLWAKDANYRHRPVIIGDMILAEPWIFDLRTGKQKTRKHPVTGKDEPWQFLRPGHHCGAISACENMLLMRSGYTGYYDLKEDSGIRHFAGHRLGCWINALPADGLALMPEASAGCICLFPIVCSVALEPRPDHYRWGIYSTGGATTPVQRMAINLGAPGDRRDEDGNLWFGYPRPGLPGDRAALGFSFPLKVEFFKGGGYQQIDYQTHTITGSDKPWIFSSYGQGIKRFSLPLIGKQDKPGTYVVQLHFMEPQEQKSATRVFSVTLQGKQVLSDFNIAKETQGANKATIRKFTGVSVQRNLEIEFVPKDGKFDSLKQAPLLSAIEIVRED